MRTGCLSFIRLVLAFLVSIGATEFVHGQTSTEPTTVHSFPGGILNGASSELVVGKEMDGWMYGACEAGGSFRKGAIYRISTGGQTEVLASFDGTNGAYLNAPVVFGTNGSIYGIAAQGGPSGSGLGTLYRYSTNGALTALVSFTGSIGTDPTSLILNTNDGFFYGTCYRFGNPPGQGGAGSVFKISHAGAFTRLHTFDGNTDGSSPNSLVLGPNGVIYGANSSLIFQVTAGGAVMPFLWFTNDATGFNPRLFACGTDGALYGATTSISNLFGSVFRLTTNGVFKTLYVFNAGTSGGRHPVSGIAVSPLGLYGTTFQALSFHGGIFRIGGTGDVVPFVTFQAGFRQTNGGVPNGLVYNRWGTGGFYGTAQLGGTNDAGIFYRLSTVPQRLSRPLLTAGAAHFSWASILGQTYQVQARSNLQAGSWTVITNVLATNTVSSLSQPVTNGSARFFRLVVP